MRRLIERGKQCGQCKEGETHSSLIRLPCSCELCTNCIGINKRSILESCIVCGKVYTASYEKSQVKRLVDKLSLEIDEVGCTKCGTKVNLVCKCLCRRCTPRVDTMCSRCKTFRREHYEASRYSSSLSDQQGTERCVRCHQEHKYIPSVCLSCKICIDCLRTAFDKNRCLGCTILYSELEKDRYNRIRF